VGEAIDSGGLFDRKRVADNGGIAVDVDGDVAATLEGEEEEGKTPHKLVTQETRSTGTIAWQVYYRYFAVCRTCSTMPQRCSLLHWVFLATAMENIRPLALAATLLLFALVVLAILI
jgi:hypothetical protein